VTNTGNSQTTFDFLISAPLGVNVEVPASLTIPAFGSATMAVVVNVPANGTYPLTLTAASENAQASDTATLIVDGIVPPAVYIYLPIVTR
jgi:hypothetical protein